MSDTIPFAEVDLRFGDPTAAATPWATAVEALERAEIYWLTTVRPDGRPHVTPLIAVLVDGALCFCTGPAERKARNLEVNNNCVVTAGCNQLHGGLDVVVEGQAVVLRDETVLRSVAERYVAKYGSDWTFEVLDGAFLGAGGPALVYRVAPQTVFGFNREGAPSQTRYRFS